MMKRDNFNKISKLECKKLNIFNILKMRFVCARNFAVFVIIWSLSTTISNQKYSDYLMT